MHEDKRKYLWGHRGVSMVLWKLAGQLIRQRGAGYIEKALCGYHFLESEYKGSCKYALDMFSLVKYSPWHRSANSSRNGHVSAWVTVVLKSPQSLIMPSLLVMGTIGAAHWECCTSEMIPRFSSLVFVLLSPTFSCNVACRAHFLAWEIWVWPLHLHATLSQCQSGILGCHQRLLHAYLQKWHTVVESVNGFWQHISM